MLGTVDSGSGPVRTPVLRCRAATAEGSTVETDRVERESAERVRPSAGPAVTAVRRRASPTAEAAPVAGGDGVGALLQAAPAAPRVQRAPVVPPPMPATGVAPRIRRAGGAVIRRKTPSGWDTADPSTWDPDTYSGFSKELVKDALDTLDFTTQRALADKWAKKALANGLVTLGSIRSTYKSSYDQDENAFSVSQNVPGIPHLVVHAHISSTDEVAYDGGVNLKWAQDEGGNKADNIPRSIGEAGLIDVDAARAHWESNSDHDAEEAKAKLARELFAAKAAAKAAAAAKKQEMADLIKWGWANTKDKIKFGKYLNKAKQAQGKGNESRMEKLLGVIRDAQAKAMAKAKASGGGDDS